MTGSCSNIIQSVGTVPVIPASDIFAAHGRFFFRVTTPTDNNAANPCENKPDACVIYLQILRICYRITCTSDLSKRSSAALESLAVVSCFRNNTRHRRFQKKYQTQVVSG